MMEVKVEKRVHKIWEELEAAEQRDSSFKAPKSMYDTIGRYQYIFSSEKGSVSMVELPNYFNDGVPLWEIYCLEGNLFEDTERFPSKEEAEKHVRGLLE